MKDYLIHRHPRTHHVEVSVVRLGEDGKPDPDQPTYVLPHLVKHSPTGFEYGYMGSGPSDLARSIVGDWMGTDDPDPRFYMAVKKMLIAPLPQEEDFHVVTSAPLRFLLGDPA